MILTTPPTPYRRDIDGLRAIAVAAVVAYHLGYAPHGWLGVDVFFVISGWLITRIILHERAAGAFSPVAFYHRRVRRILPLVLVVNAAVLLVGLQVMLPDDLENLAQSVVATNLLANNILQLVTTGNYWDVVNEHKPLMHTWSLGIEEQYYLFYPFFFLALRRATSRTVQLLLGALTVVSLGLFALPLSHATTFYLLPFRFFELSAGAMAAVALKDRLVQHPYRLPLAVALVALLVVGVPHAPDGAALVATVLVTLGLVVSAPSPGTLAERLLANRVAVGVGLLSFGIYMWHQPLLAFGRYFVFGELDGATSLLLVALTLALSAATWFAVEQPFRNRRAVSTRTLITTLTLLFVATTGGAFYVYRLGGVIRDVPELDLSTADARAGIHAEFNAAVYALNRPFASDARSKVLVVGHSFARDWVNVMLASHYRDEIDISYIPTPLRRMTPHEVADVQRRFEEAKVVFIQAPEREFVEELVNAYRLDLRKAWFPGHKSFGVSSGLAYNRRETAFTAALPTGAYETNLTMRRLWGERYIDLMGKVIEEDGRVRVFTPERKLISQDTWHLTPAGARYFASLLDVELARALGYGRDLGTDAGERGSSR